MTAIVQGYWNSTLCVCHIKQKTTSQWERDKTHKGLKNALWTPRKK